MASFLTMDLRQLAALVAVAETGSFSAAARQLNTVQSNVSTHIARLERELGLELVDRSTGQLTEAGMAVVTRARQVQTELDAITSDMASLNDEVRGQVRLGVIGTTARWLVPPLLGAMTTRHPKVQLVVVDATTTSLLPQLLGGRIDLAIVNLPVRDPDLVTEQLFDEDPTLVTPLDHPLADADHVTLADLARYPILLEPQGTGFRDLLDLQAANEGVTLVPQAEIDGMRLLATLAFQGFGAALLPASAAPNWVGGDWRRVRVEGIEGRRVGLARRRRGQLPAPARALREVVREVIADGESSPPGVHAALDRD
jgi:LysR family hydrogen peroxide-inducible transcriptional activator